MISFYPGPSRVYDAVPNYVRDAQRAGILSLNHRSAEFENISRTTVELMRKKLSVPADYTVVFTSSATECWEIIAQSLVASESIHLYNGAFGEKWLDYSRRIHPAARGISFERENPLDPELKFESGELIAITQNETSNGTQVAVSTIASIRDGNPRHLVAVDVTSSLAGISLDLRAADVWFASVQKCFGLPAGLAVIILSPRAVQRAKEINENLHFNSLNNLLQMMEKWQTPCTPNVLGIYLLMRSLKDRKSIRVVHNQTVRRAREWQRVLKKSTTLKPLIENESVRSFTVMAVRSTAPLDEIKKLAAKNGFLLGEGYGALKKETFRIANFPALLPREVEKLMKFMGRF